MAEPVVEDSSRLVIDIPMGLSAVTPTSLAETTLRPMVAVRVGYDSARSGFFWGGDVSLGVGDIESRGTSQVGSWQAVAMVEPRAKLGVNLQLDAIHLGAYGSLGVVGGVGVAGISVYEDSKNRLLLGYGVRGGIGADAGLGPVNVRIELGAGVRERGPETTTTIALGWVW